MEPTEIWPLFGLKVRTPLLELRYPDDDDVMALADLAGRGVHDPATMPFTVPWTDADPPYLQRGSAQYLWRCRAEWTHESWNLALVVVAGGKVCGLQAAQAQHFGRTRQATTGSWLGLAHQGKGLGTEMRHAVLHLLFEGLGAVRALSGAFHDNQSSRRVSEKLGYSSNGEDWVLRRDAPDRQLRLVLTRQRWQERRRDDVTITGLDACRPMFGV